MIAGVKVKPIQEIINDQGGIQHMLRSDESEFFLGFGEIYFSFVNPGVTKGWHRHSEQTSLISCITGEVQFALTDGLQSMDLRFGPHQRRLVLIPPGVIYGWKNVGNQQAILANCATHVHDPSTSEKIELDQIDFEWQTR